MSRKIHKINENKYIYEFNFFLIFFLILNVLFLNIKFIYINIQ